MKKNRVALIIAVMVMVLSVSLSFAQERLKMISPGQKTIKEQMQMPVKKMAPCKPLAFVTTSPLPETGMGYDYKDQLEASGGIPPVLFWTPYIDEKGAKYWFPGFPGYKKDNELWVDQNGMPHAGHIIWYKGFIRGLSLTASGLIQGQALDPGYYTVHIFVKDSCPSGVQQIEKDFILNVTGPSSGK
jgi:hypothetical protein